MEILRIQAVTTALDNLAIGYGVCQCPIDHPSGRETIYTDDAQLNIDQMMGKETCDHDSF